MNAHFPERTDHRILIVDDEVGVRQLFAEWLCEESYDCKTAASADEALANLADDTYALVISDMMMPGRNGIELLREIKSRYPETAVIMVSGVDRPQRVRDALRVGAFDYLIKPCEMDVLMASVERALERRCLQRTARTYKAHLENQNIELANSKAELERLQAQLVHSEKMASLGQLAGGVAHELNNPAGFIFSNMESLGNCAAGIERVLAAYDALPLSPELDSQINRVKREVGYENLLPDLSSILNDCEEGAGRIRDIVLNLRSFSRLDESEIKEIDIHAGIDATVRLLSEYYSSNRITLRREYGDLPPVECYAGQLNQVWMNLLTNAAQAICNGPGEVRIETGTTEGMVIVRISDTGTGMAPEHLNRIFDPFFTTKPVGEGTGLGLSITYGIVEKHGGTITAESAPGEGAVFTTLIPFRTKQS